MTRKIYIGPNGGKYIMRHGKKQYLVKNQYLKNKFGMYGGEDEPPLPLPPPPNLPPLRGAGVNPWREHANLVFAGDARENQRRQPQWQGGGGFRWENDPQYIREQQAIEASRLEAEARRLEEEARQREKVQAEAALREAIIASDNNPWDLAPLTAAIERASSAGVKVVRARAKLHQMGQRINQAIAQQAQRIREQEKADRDAALRAKYPQHFPQPPPVQWTHENWPHRDLGGQRISSTNPPPLGYIFSPTAPPAPADAPPSVALMRLHRH